MMFEIDEQMKKNIKQHFSQGGTMSELCEKFSFFGNAATVKNYLLSKLPQIENFMKQRKPVQVRNINDWGYERGQVLPDGRWKVFVKAEAVVASGRFKSVTEALTRRE